MAKRLTEKEVLTRIAEVSSGTIEVVDFNNFQNVHSQISVKCLQCETVHEKRLNSILHGFRCKYCNGTGELKYKYRTTSSFQKEVRILTNDEYTVIGDFTTTRKKTEFYHTSCANNFMMTPHAFITLGHRCPICDTSPRGKISKPVQLIMDTLDAYGIEYVTEKKFPGLVSENTSGGNLSFDFFIPKLNILVEYDGRQHFFPTSIFGGQHSFEKLQRNDFIKDEWVRKSKYSLLRIPYQFKSQKLKDLIIELFCSGSTTIESAFNIEGEVSRVQPSGELLNDTSSV